MQECVTLNDMRAYQTVKLQYAGVLRSAGDTVSKVLISKCEMF